MSNLTSRVVVEFLDGTIEHYTGVIKQDRNHTALVDALIFADRIIEIPIAAMKTMTTFNKEQE